MLLRVFCVVATCGLISGCATSNRLAFSGNPPGAERVSEKKHRVTLQLQTPQFSRKIDELPTFRISVMNRSEVPVGFGPASIAAKSGDAMVALYSAAELEHAIAAEAKYEGVAAEVRGTSKIQSTNLGLPYASPGRPAILAQMDALTERTAVRQAEMKRRAQLRLLVYPNSIPPGGTFGGLVKFHAEQIAPGRPLVITVTVGDERHEFVFDVTS